ncbi:hypothetical protein [Mesorhizobium sp. M7A.F.Ca.CA.004.02.1.1]|uniref:hypothetical protein n=1 Tax=Mesorhizobium sp. M7A.F.Ca.CA.004.02.1.1 TaxID=2496690 RepID=UPI000FCAD920|nr:hypothetical protein [Mesorhizobium sp. M7A.F.Ca.CA.004.02.1.1]RVB02841.1 hypothetical protein EN912_10340 [Mesorhizobium sp. M7A.F.Ca.CA.004.02.1.1]
MANDNKTEYQKFTTPRVTFVYPKLSEPDYGNEKFPKPDGEYSTKAMMSLADAETFCDTKFGGKPSLNELFEAAERNAIKAFGDLDKGTRAKFEKKGVTGPAMNALFETIYDKETEEDTGNVAFKMAKKDSGEVKKGPRAGKLWSSRPDLFDARGNKIKGTPIMQNGRPVKDKAGNPTFKFPNIWGGTTGKISFAVGDGYFIPGTAAGGLKLMLEGVQLIELVSNGSRTGASHGFGAEEGGFEYDESEQEEADDEAGDQTSDKGPAGTPAGEDDF